ncbi:MAG: hypothetical protein ACXQTD_08025 [Candidatus Syntropharchaeia archaeon]
MRHKKRGKSNREITFEMRVSVSTVKRVWLYWLTHVFANKKEKGEGAKRKGEEGSHT